MHIYRAYTYTEAAMILECLFLVELNPKNLLKSVRRLHGVSDQFS